MGGGIKCNKQASCYTSLVPSDATYFCISSGRQMNYNGFPGSACAAGGTPTLRYDIIVSKDSKIMKSH